MDLEVEHDNDATDAEYVPDKDDMLEESDSQPEPTRKPNKNRASVSKSILKYYDIRVSDEGSKIASCKVCGEDMEFTIVTQLKYHVVQNHGDLHIKDDKSSDEENKGSERGKRKPSIAWKVFNIVDPVAKIASCKCCGKELSYQASTSNLMKHVARTHGRMHLSSASSEVERPVRPKRSSGPLVRKKRSTAWKYFTIADPVAKTATCKCCGKELSYQTSTSNLMKHVLKIHADVVFRSVSSEDDVKGERDTSFTPKLRKPHVQTQFRSAAWKHFTVVDPKAKMAKCNLCRQNFSYVWISNLSKHLLRMHQEVGQSSDEEVDEVVTDATVWAYFKCLDETLKIASCLICKMRVEYNDDQDLHRHLKRKHPYVDLEETKNKPKKLMITGNGDIYEIDDDNTTKQEPESETNKEENENDSDGWQNNEEPDTLNMTETSYLDETIFDEPEYVPPKTKRRVPNPTPQQTSEETSLDIFGKYMVSLLKKLPKHTSDQLQVEFVRQIMDAQQNNQDHRYNSQKRRNSRSNSQKINNDDTRVTSNSDVQRVITTRNGEIQLSPLTVSSGSRPLTRSEQILVSSACDEITVTTE